MNNIEQQNAYGNSTINNAQLINNNLFDDPLEYYSNKKLSENESMQDSIKVMKYLINRDNLKKRFDSSNFKYEELLNALEDSLSNNTEVENSLLDDGYKSIIRSIVQLVIGFRMNKNNDILKIENELLSAKITEHGLAFKFTDKVNTSILYKEAKKLYENIEKRMNPYLICSTKYGNFFQFSCIYIEKIKPFSFFTEDINFSVSNQIIPNLIKPLYGDAPECGLREIIQNACDATKQLCMSNSENVDNSYIKINIYEENGHKKLCVRDYGVGMSRDVLLKKYFVIGESSKKNYNNTNLVGQFGIGALAAFLLGDEIEVKTRYFEEDKLYCFSYELETSEESNIEVNIDEADDFSNGTEIVIKLNNKLSTLDFQKLRKALKLDEWYVVPDVNIKYFENGTEEKILTYTGQGYNLVPLETNNVDQKVFYLDCDKSDTNSSKVILNGLMVETPYSMTNSLIKIQPILVIKDFTNKIKLNLARDRVETGIDDIIELLQDEMLRKGLVEFEKDKKNIVSNNYTILRTEYYNKYIKTIPLYFHKNGYDLYLDSNIKYKKTVFIYGGKNINNVKLSDLSQDVLYIFYDDVHNKALIADIIESESVAYINKFKIKKFFLDAESQYNGFRLSTMKILYEILGYNVEENISSQSFWTKHNSEKEAKFRESFETKEHLHMSSVNDVIIEAIDLFKPSYIKVY